ncbi:MAG: leucyl aminopeptidase, partial [Burkholderiaceae bacterium]|nr:leucyl aminopeptidase [Burkholderiaceae bacterium]
MEFSTRSAAAEAAKADCVAVGVFADGELAAQARAVDAASKGALRAAVRSGDMTGKRGSTVMLRGLPGVAAARVLMVGLGSRKDFGDRAFGEAVRTAVKSAGAGVKELAFAIADWLPAGRDSRWQARQLVLAAREAVFRVDELKSKKDSGNGGPGRVVMLLGGRDAAAAQAILDRRRIEALKMGSFMSVARGSTEPPRLIVMKYEGAGARSKAAPVVLVGKGITFDSGGISIKQAGAMDEMKFDMCGAAAVFGAMQAAADLKLKLNVVGVVPACENLPSGTASKPGDIVTSMSGQTIEVLNTDAEGRLILCDALTYAERFKPAAVVD